MKLKLGDIVGVTTQVCVGKVVNIYRAYGKDQWIRMLVTRGSYLSKKATSIKNELGIDEPVNVVYKVGEQLNIQVKELYKFTKSMIKKDPTVLEEIKLTEKEIQECLSRTTTIKDWDDMMKTYQRIKRDKIIKKVVKEVLDEDSSLSVKAEEELKKMALEYAELKIKADEEKKAMLYSKVKEPSELFTSANIKLHETKYNDPVPKLPKKKRIKRTENKLIITDTEIRI